MSEEQFIGNVNKIGIAITGQTGNLAPADKKLYALRDVTGTVDNISLIASSIMSKKIAAGADVIVLDVKTGSGAFMKTESEAFELAEEMVRIGKGAGRNTTAVVTEMDQPLGYAVGNAIEVAEAIDTLKGEGPKDLYELCIALGSRILVSAGKAESDIEARKMLGDVIENGAALSKFKEFVEAQGGNPQDVDNFRENIKVKFTVEVLSQASGYVARIHSDEVGNAAMVLGGGRETKESAIDLSVGILLNKKTGDYVNTGEPLATLYANDRAKAEEAAKRIIGAYEFTDAKPEVRPLIKGIVTV